MFKVIVAGSRNFNNYDLVKEKLDRILKQKCDEEICIISGRAKGADSLGEQYAIEHKLYLLLFPADWDKYGNKAGYIRNVEMAERADALVAFWDGTSKGTKHMIDIANTKGLKVRVINV